MSSARFCAHFRCRVLCPGAVSAGKTAAVFCGGGFSGRGGTAREPPLKCRFSREFFSFGRKNGPKYSQSALFMIFLVSLLSFLCYNNLTICFNLCPCRGTGALRRASIRRRAAGFSLQRDTTEGRSYETGKRGNS